MHPFLLRLVAIGAASLLSTAHADDLVSIDGLPTPRDAQVVDQRPAVAGVDRIYPLGAVRKISNNVRMEGSLEARGALTRLTWQLPPELPALEAFDTARQALQAGGAQILYWCQARECGESSLWANQIFGEAQLYGGDEQQAFLLLRKADTLTALYAITRGNRRAYLHAEQLAADTPIGERLPSAETVLRELRVAASLNYPDLVAPRQDWVVVLARALNQDSTLRVSVSGEQAEPWREALVAQGVRAARLDLSTVAEKGLHLRIVP